MESTLKTAKEDVSDQNIPEQEKPAISVSDSGANKEKQESEYKIPEDSVSSKHTNSVQLGTIENSQENEPEPASPGKVDQEDPALEKDDNPKTLIQKSPDQAQEIQKGEDAENQQAGAEVNAAGTVDSWFDGAGTAQEEVKKNEEEQDLMPVEVQVETAPQ